MFAFKNIVDIKTACERKTLKKEQTSARGRNGISNNKLSRACMEPPPPPQCVFSYRNEWNSNEQIRRIAENLMLTT